MSRTVIFRTLPRSLEQGRTLQRQPLCMEKTYIFIRNFSDLRSLCRHTFHNTAGQKANTNIRSIHSFLYWWKEKPNTWKTLRTTPTSLHQEEAPWKGNRHISQSWLLDFLQLLKGTKSRSTQPSRVCLSRLPPAASRWAGHVPALWAGGKEPRSFVHSAATGISSVNRTFSCIVAFFFFLSSYISSFK